MEKELNNLDKEDATHVDEEKKKQQEEAKKNGQELLEDSKSDEKEKSRTRKWLERELSIIKEAIRVRREVAVIRGAVEANRVAEGEALYGDEDEPG